MTVSWSAEGEVLLCAGQCGHSGEQRFDAKSDATTLRRCNSLYSIVKEALGMLFFLLMFVCMLYINFVLLMYNPNQHPKLPVRLHVRMSGSVTSKLHDILFTPRVCV